MSREVTDNLYIDLGYFTPEDYYTYEAEAFADFAVTATVSADVDVIPGTNVIEAQASLSIAASFNASVFRIQEFDSEFTITSGSNVDNQRLRDSQADLTVTAATSAEPLRILDFASTENALFTVGVTAVITVNSFAVLDAVVTMSSEPVRNRATTVTLENLANLAAQADRVADFVVESTASATLTAELTQLVLKDFSAQLTSATSATATAVTFVRTASPVIFRGVGKPEINYTTTKFGTGSVYLNGSSYLYASDQARFEIPSSNGSSAGNFTVEVWVYPTEDGVSSNSPRHIVGQWSSNTTSDQGWRLTHTVGSNNGTGAVNFSYLSTNGTEFSLFSSTEPLLFNQWNHIAVTRRYNSGNNLTYFALWVNGTQYDNTGLTNSALYVNSGQMRIGYNGYTNQSETYFRGYIDGFNFRVGSARYDPLVLTITQPTAEYSTVTSNDAILLNFNGDYLDQSYPKYVTASATLTSAFTQTVSGIKAVLASASLTSASTVSAQVGRLVTAEIATEAIATQLTAAGVVGDFFVNCDNTATLAADVNVIAEGEVDLYSTVTVDATADRLRESEIDFFATATQSTAAEAILEGEVDLSANFTQTTTAQRVRYADTALVTQASVDAQAQAILEGEVDLTAVSTIDVTVGKIVDATITTEAIATQLTAIAKVGDFLIACDNTATLTAQGEVTSGSVVNADVTATLAATAGLLQEGASALTSTATITAQASVVNVVDAALTAQATLDSSAVITRNSEIALTISSTAEITADKVVTAQASLSTQSNLSVSTNAIKDGIATLPVIASQLTAVVETSAGFANLTARFTVVCNTSVIHIDPALTYQIVKEIRNFVVPDMTPKVADIEITYVVPQEVRTYTVIYDQRDDIVIPENREYII